MSEVRRMGFDNLRDAWRITDFNSNFEYVGVLLFTLLFNALLSCCLFNMIDVNFHAFVLLMDVVKMVLKVC